MAVGHFLASKGRVFLEVLPKERKRGSRSDFPGASHWTLPWSAANLAGRKARKPGVRWAAVLRVDRRRSLLEGRTVSCAVC